MTLSTRTKAKPPRSLSYTVSLTGGFAVNLAWTPIESGAPRSYFVIYRDNVELTAGVTVAFYRDADVQGGESYDYRVSTVLVTETESVQGDTLTASVPGYPVWDSGWTIDLRFGETQDISIRAGDPLGLALSFMKVSGPTGVSVDSQGTVSCNSSTVGSYTMVLRADNGNLYTDTSVTMNILLGNVPPVFYLAPTSVSLPSIGGTIQFTANDQNGDTISYSMGTRTGFSINPSSGLVTVTSAAAGTSGSITVTATDSTGLSTPTSCQVTVASAVVNSPLTIQTGEYWELPDAYPTKSPYGGNYHLWQTVPRTSTGALADTVDLYAIGSSSETRWANIQTGENTFNWTRIDARLAEIQAANKKAIVWIPFSEFENGGSVAHTPSWLVSKCNLQVVPDPDDSAGTWGYAIWQNSTTNPANNSNPSPLSYWLNFIQKFGERYGTNGTSPYKSLIEAIYICTFDAGGEFFLSQKVRAYTNSTGVGGGLTEGSGGVLETYVKAILDKWLDYFTPQQCVWEGANDGFCVGAVNATRYAINTRGCSFRKGFIEAWNQSTETSTVINIYRQGIVPTAYVSGTATDYYRTAVPKDQIGLGVEFYGDEAENQRTAGVPTASTITGSTLAGMYRSFRYMVLRGLANHTSHWHWPTQITNEKDYPWANLADHRVLAAYARRVGGYPAAESPDAYASLGRWNDGVYQGYRRYCNFERFMVQRDTPADGKTDLSDTSSGWTIPSWTAPMSFSESRKTKHASGSDYIYFQVDSGFARSNENAFRVAVYYKDTGTAQWSLQYSNLAGVQTSTQTVTNGNTGTWKTAIFSLTDMKLLRAFNSSMDFRLYNGGSEDITVGMVRLIREVPA